MNGVAEDDAPTAHETALSPTARRFARLAAGLAGFMLAAAVIVTTATVVLRFAFNLPLAWAQEVGRYLFVWSVYAGVFLAVIKKSHIRVDVLVVRMPDGVQRMAAIGAKVIAILSFGFVVFYGATLAFDNVDRQFYTIPFLTLIWFYAAVPLALTASALYLLGDLIEDLRGRPHGSPSID